MYFLSGTYWSILPSDPHYPINSVNDNAKEGSVHNCTEPFYLMFRILYITLLQPIEHIIMQRTRQGTM